jgi:hypothetical protein
MTSPDYGELVKWLWTLERYDGPYKRAFQHAADALEQLTKPVASDYGDLVRRLRRPSDYPNPPAFEAANAIEQQAREIAAFDQQVDSLRLVIANQKSANVALEKNLAVERRAEMRERTIEEIAQFIENEPIHSWVLGILAKRIRALSAQPDPHKRKSMTETLMDPDEKKFWDAADRQDDEQDTGSGK